MPSSWLSGQGALDHLLPESSSPGPFPCHLSHPLASLRFLLSPILPMKTGSLSACSLLNRSTQCFGKRTNPPGHPRQPRTRLVLQAGFKTRPPGGPFLAGSAYQGERRQGTYLGCTPHQSPHHPACLAGLTSPHFPSDHRGRNIPCFQPTEPLPALLKLSQTGPSFKCLTSALTCSFPSPLGGISLNTSQMAWMNLQIGHPSNTPPNSQLF